MKRGFFTRRDISLSSQALPGGVVIGRGHGARDRWVVELLGARRDEAVTERARQGAPVRFAVDRDLGEPELDEVRREGAAPFVALRRETVAG